MRHLQQASDYSMLDYMTHLVNRHSARISTSGLSKHISKEISGYIPKFQIILQTLNEL